MLMELAPPSAPTPKHLRDAEKGTNPSHFHVDIPLHLRYLSPEAGGYADVQFPWPVVFWACPTEEGTLMSNNPFDRVNLGYDGLFGPRTMFHHLNPKGSENGTLIKTIKVPVLDLEHVGKVEMGTVATVMLGVGWVLLCLFRGLRRRTDCGKQVDDTKRK